MRQRLLFSMLVPTGRVGMAIAASVSLLLAAPSRIGPEFRVNTYTTSSQNHPAVSFLPGGQFVVVWDSYGQDGSGFGVFGQRFDSAGAPLGNEFQINTYTTANQESPS